jgi:hypothetical protein
MLLLCIAEAEVLKVVRTVSTGKVMAIFGEVRHSILTPAYDSILTTYADF